MSNPPQTHTDLNENLATDIVRGVKDEFDRLDCLVEDPNPLKISSINVSLDSQFKRSKHFSYSDKKQKEKINDSNLQDDALTLDNHAKQSSSGGHQSFMLVMEEAVQNEEPFQVNNHEAEEEVDQDLEIDSNEDKVLHHQKMGNMIVQKKNTTGGGVSPTEEELYFDPPEAEVSSDKGYFEKKRPSLANSFLRQAACYEYKDDIKKVSINFNSSHIQ